MSPIILYIGGIVLLYIAYVIGFYVGGWSKKKELMFGDMKNKVKVFDINDSKAKKMGEIYLDKKTKTHTYYHLGDTPMRMGDVREITYFINILNEMQKDL